MSKQRTAYSLPRRSARTIMRFLLLFGVGLPAVGQEVVPAVPAKPAAETVVADPPAVEALKPAQARVIASRAAALFGPPDATTLESKRWQNVEVGMLLDPATQIKTGLRGYVQLTFDDETFIEVERLSFVRLDEYVQSDAEQVIRIGLDYGAVHGGSTEMRFRSNVIVTSPVATMAKRGTDGWRIAAEAQTGRFRISLARHGLVEALQRVAGDRVVSRLVRPGEYADMNNIAGMWLKQDIFDRTIKFAKSYAVSDSDMTFTVRHSTGLAYAASGDVGSRESLVGGRAATVASLPRVFSGGMSIVVRRPEGNFGTAPAR